MRTDELDELYGVLSNALGRVGEKDASLFLATLVLELLSRHADGGDATRAIERAERLTNG